MPDTAEKRDIVLYYSTIDHYRARLAFKTLKGARKKARYWMGFDYDISETFNYAISFDGTGKLEAKGATLEELLRRGDDEPQKEAT